VKITLDLTHAEAEALVRRVPVYLGDVSDPERRSVALKVAAAVKAQRDKQAGWCE